MSRQIPTSVTANFAFTANVTATDQVTATSVTYGLALRGPATQDIAGVLTNDTITFSGVIPVAGTYRYTVYGVDAYEAKTLIETGDLKVNPDPTAIEEGSDLRTHAQKVLQAIEAVLEKRASKDQMSYTIAGRSLAKTPIADLLLLRDRYREEVSREGKTVPRTVLIQFGTR